MPSIARTNPAGDLAEQVGSFVCDPLAYTLMAFPWGEPGELEHYQGPRDWQREILLEIGARLRGGQEMSEVIQLATASGHSIGKSALVSWLVLWAMSTMPGTRGVITANTETQLRTKTWPELAKWYRLAINRAWFDLAATSIASNMPGHEKTWRIDIIPWSETNPEAFAGLHNEGCRILLVFDEASAIPDIIWETSEGVLTDESAQMIWAVFGNPTRNTGRFRECFGRRQHRWSTRQIDSRTVEGTNKKQFEAWAEDWGEDSDFVRVRVRGLFPRASELQFIPSDVVAEAMAREPVLLADDPLLMGVDVARGGDDRNVIVFRRGKCARPMGPAGAPAGVPPALVIPGEQTRDSMKLVTRVVDLASAYRPDAIFVDATGVGGPVADRVRQLGFTAIDVQFGEAAPDSGYRNMRAYLWARMRDWLMHGGAIPDDPAIEADLTAPEYGHDQRDRLQLESKRDMKARGLASPDWADALATTWAVPVAPRVTRATRSDLANDERWDYNPLELR